MVQPTPDVLRAAASTAGVPLWLPWPLPRGWLVTGVVTAGDERTGARATAVVCSGPAPLGGVAELVLVGEEMGVGLGARFAGLDGPDAGLMPDRAAGRQDPRGWHPHRDVGAGTRPGRRRGAGGLRRRGAGLLGLGGAVARYARASC